MSRPSAVRRRHRRAAAATAAAVLLLAGAGCDSGRAPDAASVPCATPGVTDSQVRIGLIYPDTGPLSSVFMAARSGFEARLALANAAGGVHGRMIKIVWVDDGGNPATNEVVARRLVERDGVFAVAELTTAASGSARYLAGADVPVVGLAAEAVWNDFDNMFAPDYLFSSGGFVTTLGEFARAQGGTWVAVVEQSLSASSEALSDQVISSMTTRGVTPVARLSYTVGQSSPEQVVARIAESQADVLVVQTPIDGLREILRASRAAHVAYKVVLSAVAYDKSLLADAGVELAGATAFFDHISWDSDSPDLARFRETMLRYASQTSDPDQVTVLNSYVAADMLLRGLAVAGPCPTRAGFHSRLRSVTDYDAAGLMPGGLDLSTNRGSPSTCLTFAEVNATGTGYEVIPGPDGRQQWCGTRHRL
ncbi:branched-chain amino acid ABC transporter substrate-binding protein [Parafrankia soli]|uniref:Branched-chain amino acid ABC transporter substrate-binding protein n=1 Tax=Parafrankia soli TaxID=2599596 RepID=A0A1S1RFG2_9ACTN|nr:branched-chain amino acid ABC transporter substrate-binding protein [Parafrankia soli]